MKYLLTGMAVCCLVLTASAQHIFKARIIDSETKEALAGATIEWMQKKQSKLADQNGQVQFGQVSAGIQQFTISFTGYQEKLLNLTFPLSDTGFIDIELEPEEEEMEEEVVVTATRISRTISAIPTRVEVISGEELGEKANMKPGDIRMLLTESTGIQTQQTSATSYNASIRIQGLDGRYTQLLRDGYPMYAGFAGGLSILQIAPLDLKQVEVIKGSASTLYGGGAIAGLVNLVSKTPTDKRELSFLANGTSAGGLDLSGFYSERYGKTGLTVFASRNSGRAYDPADIGLTAIPEFERYTLNPRLFLYGKKTTADIGLTYITENRLGGSMSYIKDNSPGFYERNNTDRFITQLGIAHKIKDGLTLQFKNSFSYFDRAIAVPGYAFDAVQQSSFSELTLTKKGAKADWVAGLNLLTEDLNEKSNPAEGKRNYHYNTVGLFIQNAWNISDQLILESGLRADYVNEFGLELLPRVSAMYRINPKLTTRLGGGFGYKTPSIFTEEAERIQFQRILPLNTALFRNERSIGVNWDLNYTTSIGALGVTLNHLFFYTRLRDPLVLVPTANAGFEFDQANGHLDTRGTETNLRLVYGDFKLFVGYTYTDANTHYGQDKNWMPLTARHRINNVLMYEVEEKWKIGLEAYHFSKQYLNDGNYGKPYWMLGFMVEKVWEKLSVYINFENFTDTRQTKFDTIFTGNINQPNFRDIYAPVDGFALNGGIKLRL
ncbi:TonB-dependent receptor [Flavihumibacter sp. UBA7668]|uniref:TonB-dependent receptor n=1 Tax=Flavihumibacter sp. UBA7668 TaxID=1946542 RepID=UPI0025C53B57|nr:TonB-dependent receptor [Flavihumibacter sp. UBA7668]